MASKIPEIVVLSDDEEFEPSCTRVPARNSPSKAAHLSADLDAYLYKHCNKLRRVRVSGQPQGDEKRVPEVLIVTPERSDLFGQNETQLSHRNNASFANWMERAAPAFATGGSSDIHAVSDALPSGPLKFEVSDERISHGITVEQLFNTCRGLAKDTADLLILDKMWGRLQKRRDRYTKMPELAAFVSKIHSSVTKDPSNIHVYLKTFYDGIEGFCKSHNSKEQPATFAETGSGQIIPVISQSLESRESTVALSRVEADVDVGASTSAVRPLVQTGEHGVMTSKEQRQKDRIEKSERLLEKLGRKIKLLEEKELDLNDLDDEESTYVQLEAYKKRFLKVWEYLCKETKQSTTAGRMVDRKFTFEGTRYPEINRQVERLVKRKFPDYCDILKIVKTVNADNNLLMKQAMQNELAREIFDVVGKELQKRRITDYLEDFGCLLPNDELLENDPADKDSQLLLKLESNRTLGEMKSNQVFELFVQKQLELENAAVSSPSINSITLDDGDSSMGTDSKEATTSKPLEAEILLDIAEEENPTISVEADGLATGSPDFAPDLFECQYEESSKEEPYLEVDPLQNIQIASVCSIGIAQHESFASPVFVKPVSVCRPVFRDSQESPPDDAGMPEYPEKAPFAAHKRKFHVEDGPLEEPYTRQPVMAAITPINYQGLRKTFMGGMTNTVDDDDVIFLE